MAPGRTVITGVSPSALRLDGVGATEDRVHALAALLDLDDVDQQAGADARPPAGPRSPCRRRWRPAAPPPGWPTRRATASTSTVRGDQVLLDVVGLGDVDLRRAGRLQRVGQRRGGARRADHDGRRLAQRAGGGDQFGGDLLQRAFGVLDEHKYFSHGLQPL